MRNLLSLVYAEAEPLYQRALAISEKALGPEHQQVATSLNGLALLYKNQGKYSDAKPLYERALAIREKVRPCRARSRYRCVGSLPSDIKRSTARGSSPSSPSTMMRPGASLRQPGRAPIRNRKIAISDSELLSIISVSCLQRPTVERVDLYSTMRPRVVRVGLAALD